MLSAIYIEIAETSTNMIKIPTAPKQHALLHYIRACYYNNIHIMFRTSTLVLVFSTAEYSVYTEQIDVQI